MAPSKLRKALGAVKDKTSIGLAKVGGGSGFASPELEVAIVKATKHDENFPADERHIREIVSLTRDSRGSASACVAALSRRLGRTRSWDVALKTLVIVHRLLAEGDPVFEQELFYATRRGTRMLNMSDFCGRASDDDAWDYSAFVRTYAAYLDDRLEHRIQARQGGPNRCKLLRDELYMSPGDRLSREGVDGSKREDAAADADAAKAGAIAPRETPTSEMTLEQLLAKVQQLQHLLDRFIACRPVGAAKTNRVVSVSLYPLVKESVQLYCELTEVMAALMERFPDMESADCERVTGVFCGLAKQIEDLDSFYACPEPEVEEYDMSAARALPAPAEPPAAVEKEPDASETAHAEPEAPLITTDVVDEEADFLNLKADAMSGEEHGRQLALALFDGNPAGSAPTCDVFDPSSADWETALVESASALANQRAMLGGGLDMMALEGMYNHATAANAQAFSGSASSVALRPPGAPMLALPAPPGMCSAAPGGDPFAASMVVPPPTYVQMSDMQTKQQLLTEEQMAWQQYGKNGMQGQGGLAMREQRPQQLMPPGVYHRAS
ncbi:putative clathrin assembly protein At1g03050 [Triticum dicoccoides]|uniref:putative clathrin assembly protein At1g03050 n=1 Tax=Triticum dicoccoides TaxID=85692 RepID=UPI001890642B|nr:putative clathrin assembly protein At1g03050 [Triticum dicoccoides]